VKFILGADPGMKGGLALIDQHGNLMDTADISGVDGRVDVRQMRGIIVLWQQAYGIHMGVVENVGAMPKQGVSTTYKFGRATGTLEGVIQALEIPMDLITPAQWKQKMKMVGKPKDFPRQWCRKRWPTVNHFDAIGKGQARADATCMALAWLELHPEFREGGAQGERSKRPPPRARIVP